MSGHDDPERDEAPASAAEQAQAAAFARRVTDLLAGEPLAPAMAVEDRAMVVAAGQILASSHVVELAPARQRRIIDRALEEAAIGAGGLPEADRAAADHDPGSSALWPAPRRRVERIRRAVPWAVATIAAVAAIVLFVTRPADLTRELRADAALPAELTSRPSDALIGQIPRREVAAATARIDEIWADRMAGYRTLRLGSGDAR